MAEFSKVYNQGRWYIVEGNSAIFEIIADYYSSEEIDLWVNYLNVGSDEGVWQILKELKNG